MRKILILAFMAFALFPQVVQPRQTDPSGQEQKIDEFKKRYFEKRILRSIGVSQSYYEILLEINRESLSESSRTLLDDILAILRSPEDGSLRTKYINDFPRTFSEFCRIFPPLGPKELAHPSFVFMEMFKDILSERPQENVGLLIGLSVNAKLIGDGLSPEYLRNVLSDFSCNFYDVLICPFNKLDYSSQQNIITFICNVEAIEYYREFDCIIRTLKEEGNIELLKRFMAAKEERISMGPHGEKKRK